MDNLIKNDNRQWYKDAIFYELHVKSFYDNSNDGIGDFIGLVKKLDYLKGLGITAIWLLPFYVSPRRDDGYDIADYYNIHPDYGKLHDFRLFLKEAHKRELRIVIEFVINHTSDQHPWFQRARRSASNSAWRNYYVWNETPDKYKDARIIFKDFETSNWSYDPVAKSYYWHRFYSHQPDLNFDNPRVHREIFRIIDFWFAMGVDGMRLDAVPYLYEREGTNCENLPETHNFLKKLRAYVDNKYEDKLLLAEANQWPEDAAQYFGNDDECQMAFHFPIMPRLFMAFRMEDRFPIVDILVQTPQIPDSCQWAMFLRNHDELTLEMVTDEERDYMYRVYAKDYRARINLGIRRRLAPLLNNNRKKIELMNILLFSLPGTPVIFYGDEIGMGDNYYLGDRDGVRTPMQWSADRNAGFSKANPQKLFLPVVIDPEYSHEALNVENQEQNLSSLLWWMKRVIEVRKRYKAFSRGTIEFIHTKNPQVLSFIRKIEGEILLIVINLSRFSQYVELNLLPYKNYTPQEIFSQNKFLKIRKSPYLLTLGPYDHYWFLLTNENKNNSKDNELTKLTVDGMWTSVFKGKARSDLENNILPIYLKSAFWFVGKGKNIRQTTIVDVIPVEKNGNVMLTLIEVEYTADDNEIYLIPMSFITKSQSEEAAKFKKCIIARLEVNKKKGWLYDAIFWDYFHTELLTTIKHKTHSKGEAGEIFPIMDNKFGMLLKNKLQNKMPRMVSEMKQNPTINYNNTFFIKLYRRIDETINPEPELVKFLAEKTTFRKLPLLLGRLEYKISEKNQKILALVQENKNNEGDALTITMNAFNQYCDNVLARRKELMDIHLTSGEFLRFDGSTVSPIIRELIDPVYLEQVHLLAQMSGELHLALASDDKDANFCPESFSRLYTRSIYQSIRSNVKRGIQYLSNNINRLPLDTKPKTQQLLLLENDILNYVKTILDENIQAKKIRVHGDYDLKYLHFSGKEFFIIDFEGDSSKTPSERRLKYTCLKDIASIMCSFHSAVHQALYYSSLTRSEDLPLLKNWTNPWYQCVNSVFLNSYVNTVKSSLLPNNEKHQKLLLTIYLIDKAIHDLIHKIANSPKRAIVPINCLKLVLRETGIW